MRELLRFGLVILVAPASVLLMAQTANIGDSVHLKATHPDGVPVHSLPEGTNGFLRVPDGSSGEVTRVNNDNGWLQLYFESGQSGWVTPRYVSSVTFGASDPESPTAKTDAQLVWASLQGCSEVVNAGRRLPSEIAPGSLRVGTWNVRWFPRGCPRASDCPENATNVEWLACTIAWMDLDLLAIQEILNTPDADQQIAHLRQELNELTGGKWDVDLQACGHNSVQKVGFLWNRSTVALDSFSDSCQLNGAADGAGCSNACAGNLRPGRYTRAASRSSEGVDFHILSVHLDSGRSNRDFTHRQIAMKRISALKSGSKLMALSDEDVVVLGDFNTMGRGEPPVVHPSTELNLMDESLGEGYKRLIPSMQCTHYYRGDGGALDHIVVSAGMAEAVGQSVLSGYCAARSCTPFDAGPPPAYKALSDHCPVLLDIRDEDVD